MKNILVLFICMAGILGCQKDFPSYLETVSQMFEGQFTKLYGTPDSRHTWGFIDTDITRSSDVNSNMWSWRPADITEEESLKVSKFFKNTFNPTGINVNWLNFFVQHVYSGHGNMDHLRCGNQDHVSNFNATNGSIMKMVNSSTSNFEYHNSLDSKYHNEYVVVLIDGSYYVGFDFCATGLNPNLKETADGYYDDWIIKISPAYNKIIIAEDLGVAESDYDYNDVVFGIDDNVVTLLAAGGTLPLYIDGKEVHEVFGVSTNTMVNTINYNECSPVLFSISNYVNIKDIPIVVNKGGVTYSIPYFTGKPSAKICVEHNFIWCKERIPIHKVYPEFNRYVKDLNVIWY